MAICNNNLTVYGANVSFGEVLDDLLAVSDYDMFTDFCVEHIAKGNFSTLSQLTFIEWDEKRENISDVDYMYLFGTKWIDIMSKGVTSSLLKINFDSAYTPPIALAELISLRYKASVKISYSEPLENNAGYVNFCDGKLLGSREMGYYEHRIKEHKDYESLLDLLEWCNSPSSIDIELMALNLNLTPAEDSIVRSMFRLQQA